jgi:hypothetical protein
MFVLRPTRLLTYADDDHTNDDHTNDDHTNDEEE